MNDTDLFSIRLARDLKALAEIDLESTAAHTGAQWRQGVLWLVFFNRKIGLCPPDVLDADQIPVTDAVKSVLVRYVLNCRVHPRHCSGRLVSFREFDQAGPLIARFQANTAKVIASAFSGRMALLEQRCKILGGRRVPVPGFDLGIRFQALPRVPVDFFFNDADGAMPASASFLFDENVCRLLDLKSLMALATCMTGSLIGQ